VKAYKAICILSSDPARTVPMLRKELQPAAAIDPKAIARLIADLDSDRFETRQEAFRQLDKLGEAAMAAMRKALAADPSAEVRKRLEELLEKQKKAGISSELLRAVRAVEVLERMGSAEAKEVLQTLAKGTGTDRRTQEAQAALERLQR
jgi:hypothetical protein